MFLLQIPSRIMEYQISTFGCTYLESLSLIMTYQLLWRRQRHPLSSLRSATAAQYHQSRIRCCSSRIRLASSASLATSPFTELVAKLKSTHQTCTIIESSCGGLIQSSLMSVPGSSKVYWYVCSVIYFLRN